MVDTMQELNTALPHTIQSVYWHGLHLPDMTQLDMAVYTLHYGECMTTSGEVYSSIGPYSHIRVFPNVFVL